MGELKDIIYIQISAGRGTAECAWVVSQVLKVLVSESKKAGLFCEAVNRNKGHKPGTLEFYFDICVGIHRIH